MSSHSISAFEISVPNRQRCESYSPSKERIVRYLVCSISKDQRQESISLLEDGVNHAGMLRCQARFRNVRSMTPTTRGPAVTAEAHLVPRIMDDLRNQLSSPHRGLERSLCDTFLYDLRMTAEGLSLVMEKIKPFCEESSLALTVLCILTVIQS